MSGCQMPWQWQLLGWQCYWIRWAYFLGLLGYCACCTNGNVVLLSRQLLSLIYLISETRDGAYGLIYALRGWTDIAIFFLLLLIPDSVILVNVDGEIPRLSRVLEFLKFPCLKGSHCEELCRDILWIWAGCSPLPLGHLKGDRDCGICTPLLPSASCCFVWLKIVGQGWRLRISIERVIDSSVLSNWSVIFINHFLTLTSLWEMSSWYPIQYHLAISKCIIKYFLNQLSLFFFKLAEVIRNSSFSCQHKLIDAVAYIINKVKYTGFKMS